MSKIRILVVEPNKEPYQMKIENTLENLQDVVKGLIEAVELEYNVDLICNEEGKIHNLPMNRVIPNDIICGTFFITGQKEGEFISLSRKQIKKYKKRFRLSNDKLITEVIKGVVGDSSNLLKWNMYGIEKIVKPIK